jgi:hypothetical protein
MTEEFAARISSRQGATPIRRVTRNTEFQVRVRIGDARCHAFCDVSETPDVERGRQDS